MCSMIEGVHMHKTLILMTIAITIDIIGVPDI
jgi:hypothetical protein